MGKHYPRFLASLLLLLLLCASVLFPMQSQAKENTFVMKESSDHTTRKLSVDPISSRDQYSAVLYDNTNGLPTSEANDIAETSNGFLWIGKTENSDSFLPKTGSLPSRSTILPRVTTAPCISGPPTASP